MGATTQRNAPISWRLKFTGEPPARPYMMGINIFRRAAPLRGCKEREPRPYGMMKAARPYGNVGLDFPQGWNGKVRINSAPPDG